MKKILALAFITTSLILICGCVSDYQRKYQNLMKDYRHTVLNGDMVDSVGLRVNHFEYQNHNYILFTSPDGSPSVVHNPNCAVCIAEELVKELFEK